jgi:ADP-ribose pyrophosphatase YjhB (NUDIX family)
MAFLRLGTACAVFDDDGRVLLSHRGDIDVWNLPTGRLDAHEALDKAAAREAWEETGIRVTVDRPIGLYYFQASQRMNILFSGVPIGGELQTQTDEARDNRYFWPSSLPEKVFGRELIQDAAHDIGNFLRATITPSAEMRKIRRQLAVRWVKNLLRGTPEPRHVRFEVNAVGMIWDQAHRQLLTLQGKRTPTLPRVRCDGRNAPWEALSDGIAMQVKKKTRIQDWHWVGVWQQPSANKLEFVFAATVNEQDFAHHNGWTSIQNSALMGNDDLYLARTRPTYRSERVWIISE